MAIVQSDLRAELACLTSQQSLCAVRGFRGSA
jgi:hypothetical protein